MVSVRERVARFEDPPWLLVQYGVVGATITVLFAGGYLGGRLTPLLTDRRSTTLLVPAHLLLYLLAVVGFLLHSASRRGRTTPWSGASDGDGGERTTPTRARDRHVGQALLATAAGGAVGAVLVFSVPAWLSTTVPLVALTACAVGFGLAGIVVPDTRVETALSTAAATIALLLLSVVLVQLVDIVALLLAPVVGLLFLLTARARRRTVAAVGPRVAAPAAVALLLVAGGAVAYDLTGPRPTVTTTTVGEVDRGDAQQRQYQRGDVVGRPLLLQVGTVTAENDFPFSRQATLPEYRVCLYNADGEPMEKSTGAIAVVEFDEPVGPVEESRIAGQSTREFPVVVFLDQIYEPESGDTGVPRTIPVRRTETCPDETDGPAIVLAPRPS